MSKDAPKAAGWRQMHERKGAHLEEVRDVCDVVKIERLNTRWAAVVTEWRRGGESEGLIDADSTASQVIQCWRLAPRSRLVTIVFGDVISSWVTDWNSPPSTPLRFHPKPGYISDLITSSSSCKLSHSLIENHSSAPFSMLIIWLVKFLIIFFQMLDMAILKPKWLSLVEMFCEPGMLLNWNI